MSQDRLKPLELSFSGPAEGFVHELWNEDVSAPRIQIRRRRSLEERFWSNVNKSEETECWEWARTISDRGYGHFRIGGLRGITVLAHRVAWELSFGSIPDGLQVLHTCDNRRCVNPVHLWLGTPLDNMRDMIAKGRKVVGKPQCGSANKLAKLNEDIVKEIREGHRNGSLSIIGTARRLGVTRQAIWQVVNGRSWRHVK